MFGLAALAVSVVVATDACATSPDTADGENPLPRPAVELVVNGTDGQG